MSGLEQVFRQYTPDECGPDGYPVLWHKGIVLGAEGPWVLSPDIYNRRDQHSIGIKDLVRQDAGHRCVRCLHPYECGEHGNGEWSPCDKHCTHLGPYRYQQRPYSEWDFVTAEDVPNPAGTVVRLGYGAEAQWRILTVHHLNQLKADCRWWNLAALCQRCHLQIQRKVVMEQVWPFEHSEWFKPYAAGFYAATYLDEELTRQEVEARMDELLALERVA